MYVIFMSCTSFRVSLHSILFLNVKELLAQSRLHIWSLSDCNGIRTHNHFVRKRTLNHLANWPNDWAVLWVLICTVYLTVCYYHVMYEFQGESTLYNLPECQGTPCSKQAPYLKFKWQQRDSNQHPLSSKTNTQPFSEIGQMIELFSEYLSLRCIWLCVIIMSRTSFRVNLHPIVCLNVKKRLVQSRRHFWSLSDSNSETRTWHDNNITVKCTVQRRTHNTTQSFGQFD